MKIFKHAELRQEFIKIQTSKTKFAVEMEKIIDLIMAQVKKGYRSFEIQAMKEVRDLEKLIFDHLGIRVVICTDGEFAAIIPFYLGENSIFFQKTWRGNMIIQSQEELRFSQEPGWVDEATGRVGGVFSKYGSNLYLNFSRMEVLTTPEIAAIILHELGHFFYGCYYAATLDRGNQILNDALKKSDGKKGEEKIQIFFKEISKSHKELPKNLHDDMLSKNPVVFGRAAYTLINEVCLSQMANGWYNNTSFEQLADNYAARNGYGVDLGTGLQKITGGTSYWSEMFGSLWIMMQMADAAVQSLMLFQVLSKMAGGTGFVQAVISFYTNLLIGGYFLYYMAITSGETGRQYTYDDLPKRYNRIRHQLIEKIKQKAYNKGDVKQILDATEVLAKLIKDCRVYRGPIDFMFNTFNPKDRRAKSSIVRQQALEDLLNNDLFIKSLQLKQ